MHEQDFNEAWVAPVATVVGWIPQIGQTRVGYRADAPTTVSMCAAVRQSGRVAASASQSLSC